VEDCFAVSLGVDVKMSVGFVVSCTVGLGSDIPVALNTVLSPFDAVCLVDVGFSRLRMTSVHKPNRSAVMSAPHRRLIFVLSFLDRYHRQRLRTSGSSCDWLMLFVSQQCMLFPLHLEREDETSVTLPVP